MKFLLKRRLNPFLLLTTIVALSLLTAVTIVQNEGNRELSENLNDTRDRYNELNQSYTQVKNELNTSRANEEQLQDQISELENQLQNRSQSTESLEQRITELENQTQQLRDENNDLQSEYDQARRDILTICDNEDGLSENSQAICRVYRRE